MQRVCDGCFKKYESNVSDEELEEQYEAQYCVDYCREDVMLVCDLCYGLEVGNDARTKH